MLTSTLASVLTAFFAAAGGIPLFRKFSRWLASSRRRNGDERADTPMRAAGAGMLLGGAFALFYLNPGPLGEWGLLVAGGLMIAVGGWVDHRRREQDRTDGVGPLGWVEIGIALVAGIVLLASFQKPLALDSAPLAGAICMILVTPLAIAHLGRTADVVPSLPAGMVVVQLLLLGGLAFLGAGDDAGVRRYEQYGMLAIPAIGALAGALLYLLRMPWRSRAEVSLGTGAHLCMGLLVAWGGAVLGLVVDDPARSIAVMWILAWPVLEMMAWGIQRLRVNRSRVGGVDASVGVHHTAGASELAPLLTLVMGGTGILLECYNVPSLWALVALISCLAVRIAYPAILSSRGSRPPLAADARRRS